MSQLALLGGNPAAPDPLTSAWPIVDETEEKLVLKALRSGKWCRLAHDRHPEESMVAQFEDAFAKYTGAKHAVAVTNGTQALECALKAAGIGAGDEVIVPALTFVATATAVALVNATPVVVDVDPASYNIDPDAIEAAITEKTKAVIPVHNGGYPADMDRIMPLARKHGLVVIEDCAHAHGSQWKGRGLGSIGDMGCFSFQQGKTMTAGEGGIVLTNDDDLAGAVYSAHNIGRVAGRPFTEFHRVASNVRMTEIQGAILLAQLARLPEQVAKREENTAYLAEGLKEIAGVDALERDERVTRWCFYYWNFKYNPDEFAGVPKSTFIRAMNAEGIPVRSGAHGVPIYHHPVLKETGVARVAPCPEAERIAANEALSFPHALFLGERSEMDIILKGMAKVRSHADELLKSAS